VKRTSRIRLAAGIVSAAALAASLTVTLPASASAQGAQVLRNVPEREAVGLMLSHRAECTGSRQPAFDATFDCVTFGVPPGAR